LGSLIMLKMMAWLDRPHERGKDLEDFRRVLDYALGEDDECRWDSQHPVGSRDLAHDEQAAFYAGWELGRIAEQTHQAYLLKFLDALRDDESAAFARMLGVSRGPPTSYAVDRLRRQLSAFEAALGAG
jgi:predicted nucleotidyltransferase